LGEKLFDVDPRLGLDPYYPLLNAKQQMIFLLKMTKIHHENTSNALKL
jgi:hypothetical protein